MNNDRREHIYQKIKSILLKEVEKDCVINNETTLSFDLGITSLSFFKIINEIETSFHVVIKDSDISSLNTVGDLVDYINNSKIDTAIHKRATCIDIAKGLCLLGLSFVHVLEMAISYGAMARTGLNIMWILVLSIVGPGIFLICMGYDIKSDTPAHKLAKTGLQMLLIGFILNFLRFFIPLLIEIAVAGDEVPKSYLFTVLFESDIYYCVGLFYLLFALFKKLKLSDFSILLVGLVMLLFNSFFYYLHIFDFHDASLNSFFGNFLYTNELAYFPSMSWFIFPIIGIFIAKKPFETWKFKHLFLGLGACALTILLIMGGCFICHADFYRILVSQAFDYRSDIINVVLQISFSLLLLFALQIIIKICKRNKIEDLLKKISFYLMPFYFIHWLVVGWVTLFFVAFFYNTWSVPSWVILLFCFAVLALSLFISLKKGNKLMILLVKVSSLDFFKKNKLKPLTLENKTIHELLELSMKAYPNSVIYEDCDLSITRKELLKSSQQISSYLKEYGYEKSNVGILCDKSVSFAKVYFGVTYGSQTAVLFNPDLTFEILKEQIEHTDIKLLIYPSVIQDKVHALLKELSIHLDIISFDELFDKHSYVDVTAPHEDDVSTIIFTSGTTGKSKGVMLTHKNLMFDVSNTLSFVISENFLPPYDIVAILPCYHAFAISFEILFPLMGGGKSYFNKEYKNIIEDIVTSKPTYLVVVPAILEMILKHFDLNNKDINLKKALGGKLDYIFCGGATFPISMYETYHKTNVQILNGYGISECSPVISFNLGKHSFKDSLGVPLKDIEVKISNEQEILVKGDNVMKGYYGNQEETKNSFTNDGYFKTGDLGRLGEHREIYFLGRKKNLIILSNGENISPEIIENKLLEYPCIKDVKVKEENNHIIAEILPEYEIIDVEVKIKEVVEEVNNKLPSFMRIQNIKIIKEDFSRTSLGKIVR